LRKRWIKYSGGKFRRGVIQFLESVHFNIDSKKYFKTFLT